MYRRITSRGNLSARVVSAAVVVENGSFSVVEAFIFG